jgi:L-lysine exporter family protein LysE/ArgO
MSAIAAGFTLSLSLIMAIGPQNAHVLRMGLARRHLIITVLACAVTDFILIGLGVLGFAKISALSPMLHNAIALGAFAFLVWYGFQAAQRALKPSHDALQAAEKALPNSLKSALMTALAFSWLNPHAWLDTAVLIGTASLAYGKPNNYAFGLGAGIASFVWFCGLAWIAARLSQHLAKPATWRAIDCLVAITMWGTAVWVALDLYKRMAGQAVVA